LTDWHKVFAVVAMALLAGGAFAIARVQYSTGVGLPKGPIWMWVPSRAEIPDYFLNRIDLFLYVWHNDSGRLDVDFDVSIVNQNQFGFAIMQPLPVLDSSALNLYSNTPDVTNPNTTLLENGEFLTRVIFTPHRLGQAVIRISVSWLDAVSVKQLGKRVIYLTFWGSTRPMPPFMEGLTTDPILNGAIFFSVYCPTDWHFSPPDTHPPPDKAYVSLAINAVTWQIDFTRPPSNYAESLTIGLGVPEESAWRDWLTVGGTVLIASGAGLLSDAVLDALKQRRRAKFNQDE
jgi:hypothetical protein